MRLFTAAVLGIASACTPAHTAEHELALPGTRDGSPTAPGPAPRLRSFDSAEVNARCAECHADIASEWAGSLHRMAHTDPSYQRQFVREPFPFCTACHAPEAIPTEPVPEPLSQIGVACVTCHVVGDHILAASKSDSGGHDGEHHTLTRTAAMAGSEACAACHEFSFPEERGRDHPLMMQSTISEHAASSYRDRSCASCHMPVVPGTRDGAHRSHAFAASRDEAMVRSAIVVDESPLRDGVFTLTLRPGKVGHAFPTGDMLRRLALRIEAVDETGRPVRRDEHFFGRRFGYRIMANVAPRRVLAADQRVGVAASPITVRYDASALSPGARIHYTLRYERVGDPTGDDGRAVIDGSVLLAGSTISIASAAPAAISPPRQF